MAPPPASLPELLAPRFNGRELALWATAAVLIVSAHAGSVWAFSQLRPEEQAAAQAAPVVAMIDLAPMVVAPDAVPDEMADMVESIETPMLETPPDETEAVEPVEPAPVQKAEEAPLEPVEQEPVEVASVEPPPEPEMVEPAPAEPVVPEAVVETIEEVVEKQPEKVEPAPEPKPKPKPVKKAQRKPVPKPSVTRKIAAQEAPRAAAPRPVEGGATNGVSPARWQSRVNAHLNRYKRYPSGESAQGTASVRFTIDATGRVTGVSLVRSSGSGALDQAAVDMVRRASPVPAPPPAIAKPSMSLTVPVQFSRR